MVDHKFTTENYMVKDSILQIIYSSLINYLNEDDVNYISDYNRYKYILRLNDFSIEIVFYFITENVPN